MDLSTVSSPWASCPKCSYSSTGMFKSTKNQFHFLFYSLARQWSIVPHQSHLYLSWLVYRRVFFRSGVAIVVVEFYWKVQSQNYDPDKRVIFLAKVCPVLFLLLLDYFKVRDYIRVSAVFEGLWISFFLQLFISLAAMNPQLNFGDQWISRILEIDPWIGPKLHFWNIVKRRKYCISRQLGRK